MEFRCRLGTTSGEIIEGVYVAQSEAALRRELEDKGLHVLSLKPRLGAFNVSFGKSRKISRHEFLVFNQELATLLKAGMPLMAGERSGNLDSVLRRFVAYSKTVDTVRTKTISAMIYPAILVALAVVLVSIIIIKVVPTFADFYTSFESELPLSTQLIVAVSD